VFAELVEKLSQFLVDQGICMLSLFHCRLDVALRLDSPNPEVD
jgi:hypothetical protein